MDSDFKIDAAMSCYFNCLFEDDAPYNEGSYTLFGWIALKAIPRQPERELLPLARAALSAWRAARPGTTRVGVPPQVIFHFARYCVKHSEIHAAVAALLQFDLYARPSEILDISGVDLVRPVKSLSDTWGIILGNADRERRTKTGATDDIILADSPHRLWCGRLLQHVARGCLNIDVPVFSLTLAKYEDLFRHFSSLFKLPAGTFTPHTIRHSGPSFDAIHKFRTLTEIQQRGRWASPSSVQRYKKPGRLLLHASRLPDALKNDDPRIIQAALTDILRCPWVTMSPEPTP